MGAALTRVWRDTAVAPRTIAVRTRGSAARSPNEEVGGFDSTPMHMSQREWPKSGAKLTFLSWAGDERRLAEASAAVLGYLRRHPISATWGRSDLASSDMMSLETRQRVWQARVDPRRQTPSVGIYSHVRDRWGIFYAQPIVLNERQVGAAIET